MTLPNFEALWGAIPYPAFVFNNDNTFHTCNSAAESFSGKSVNQMRGRKLSTAVGEGSVLQSLVDQARSNAVSVVLHGVEISWADQLPRINDLHATNISNGQVLLLLHPRGLAEQMDRSLTHRSAARSVAGMAAMLAHEIRNPLAGINGAAQLLAMSVADEDQELTTLIQDEIRRIGRLVDRMEQFGDLRPAQREAVNIHGILDRAKRAAEVGFADHVRFIEDFDPSLPPVNGDEDQLSQVFQNLLKNAAEATPKVGGVITIKTAFRPGVRLQMPGQRSESLPLEVTITDNGVGIPPELINDIFDPFVSSKAAGTGLGLSLVSKNIVDHGGVVECISEPGKTKLKVLLPIWRETDKEV